MIMSVPDVSVIVCGDANVLEEKISDSTKRAIVKPGENTERAIVVV
jgi:hypothetical protein